MNPAMRAPDGGSSAEKTVCFIQFNRLNINKEMADSASITVPKKSMLYPQILQPEGLSISLYQHQRVSVHKMEELEKYRKVNIHNNYGETDFGILGDIPGYGKSYSMVALILRDKMEWDITQPYMKNGLVVLNPSVRIIIPQPDKKRVKTNLIVCSISIMKQWKYYFDQAPSLSVYEISTKKNIADFKLGKHDVVIVSSTQFNYFTDVIEQNIIWKRFIFDEASSTYITSMNTVYFGFMWLITATWDFLYSIRGNRSHFLKNFFNAIPYNYLPFFVIKNEENFIHESFTMPPIQRIVHQCINPRILQVLGNYIDTETQTMITAGNIRGAIERLGGNIYSSNNLFDIVKTKKQEKIISCTQSLDFWTKRGIEKEIVIWKSRLDELQKEMNDIETKYNEMLHDECSICYEEVTNHTMVSCCNHIFCGNCIMKWLQANNTCPLCRHKLTTSELSFIGEEKDKKSKENTKKSKKDIVIDIIKDCVEKKRKIILFSSYDETFDNIRSILEENDIDYAELCGQKTTRESKLEQFVNGTISLIFLNSRFNGSGINLQVTDDIILYHRMSENIKKQVMGRALRIGRTTELTIHEFDESD